VKSGDLSLEELFDLADREECVAQMRAHDLVSSLPSIGEVKAERIMARASIAKTRRIRGLGPSSEQNCFEPLCAEPLMLVLIGPGGVGKGTVAHGWSKRTIASG